VKQGQKERVIAFFSDEKLKRFHTWPVSHREDLDGIKLYFGGIGWLMVRASGTENLLRIYSETSNPETTRQVLRAVEAAIHEL